ncbi:MAG: hypothetical protein IJV82_00530 [Oscillospiraceae bacterium]|nr:hypothetical protein [Oscillospiraceae bacterium]
MFCKNCGATISASDEKCARCGFQAPALSDCGGFYDLAPHAPKAAAPVMPKEPAPAPEAPRREVPAPARTSTLWIAVLGGLMLLILALQVLVLVKLADHENRIHNVSSNLSEMESIVNSSQPSNAINGSENTNLPTDSTDPEGSTPPPESNESDPTEDTNPPSDTTETPGWTNPPDEQQSPETQETEEEN